MIQKPAIGHDVHRRVWRIDVDRTKGAIPEFVDRVESHPAGISAAKTLDQLLDFTGAATNTQPEGSFVLLAIAEVEGDLHCAARIEPRADFAGEAGALEGRGSRKIAVASEEFFAVTGERAASLVHIEEDDAVGEFDVVKISREQGAGLTHVLALGFFLISVFFVWRSFYAMRIGSAEVV